MTPAFKGMLFDRSWICASCGAAMAAVLVAALGLLMARIVRGKPAPLRYGLLLAALVVLGVVPAVAAASRLAGWGAVRLSPVTVDRLLAPQPFLVMPAVPRPAPVPASAASEESLRPKRATEPAVVPMDVPTFREAASGLLWVWLGGVVFSVGLVIRDLLRLRRLRQSLVPCPSPAALGLLGEAARSVGLVNPPRLYESAAVPVPVVIGPAKPAVVLPAGMATSLEPEKLSAVLLHEAAHVVHGDLWVGLLQHAVAAVFWWCPPVHRLNRRLADIREEICDDYVVSAQGDGFQLAEVLVEMAAGLRDKRRLAIGTLGAIDEKPALEGRVERLVDLAGKAIPMTRMNRMAVAATGAFGAVALAIVVATTIHAADEPPVEAQHKAPAMAAAKVTVSDAHELAGTVVDEAGRPLSNATIDAWHWYPGNETKTDEQGRFRLTGLNNDGSSRKIELLITKPGYTPVHIAQQPIGVRDWVVTLGNQTYLEGTVTREGKPVPGVTLRATFGPVRGDGFTMSEVAFVGKSGDDGSYRLYVPQGTYSLQASGGPAGTFRRAGIVVEPHEAQQVDVALDKGLRLEFHVVDSVTGEPVEDFILWQWRGDKLFGRSDANGRIVFEDLVPGEIEFQCGGGTPIDNPIDNGERTYYAHGPFGRWWSAAAKHEQHRFRLDNRSTSWQRNFDSLVFDLQPSANPIVIVTEQGTRVSGRVTDPEGKPVEGATVAPARTGSGNSLTGDTRYSVRTDKEGRYEVVLPASNGATYNLMVHDGDYGKWRTWANGVAAPMQTKPGQVIDDLDLQLTKPAIIRGTVTLGGRPLVGREVRTHAFDKRENRYYDPTTRTAEDGSFELKFVRPGKHYLQVEPFFLQAEDASLGSRIVDVEAGETLHVDLIGQPTEEEWERIAALPFFARVVDADGQPVAGVAVGLGLLGGLASPDGTLAGLGENGQVVRTNAEGTAPLPTRTLAEGYQKKTLVYAVDASGKRAGVGMLDLLEHADTSVGNPPEPVTVVLVSAAATRFVFDTSAFDELPDRPLDLRMGVVKDGLPLQYDLLDIQAARALLLPPGAYRVSAGGDLAEMVTAEFTLNEGDTDKEITLKISPTHTAKLTGRPAPAFDQVRSLGDAPPEPLAGYRGKVVVLDFWGTWCGPCVAAMPNLMRLHDEFATKGVEFIALHDDSVDSTAALRKQLDTLARDTWAGRSIPFTVLLDGGGPTTIPGSTLSARGATTAAYGVTAFPTTVLIDRDGIMAGTIPAHDLEASRTKIQALVD